jgi:hypothetical protein
MYTIKRHLIEGCIRRCRTNTHLWNVSYNTFVADSHQQKTCLLSGHLNFLNHQVTYSHKKIRMCKTTVHKWEYGMLCICHCSISWNFWSEIRNARVLFAVDIVFSIMWNTSNKVVSAEVVVDEMVRYIIVMSSQCENRNERERERHTRMIFSNHVCRVTHWWA